MKLKDFIKQFSHNNEVWVENNKKCCMQYRYNESEPYVADEHIMDWELLYTDIAECDMLRISNGIHRNKKQAITFKVDTDKEFISFVPELVTIDNSPLWLYIRVHKTNIQGCCGG